MKYLAATLLIMLGTVPAQADCAIDKISAALGSSLESMKPLIREVTDVRSTDGGEWNIYRENDDQDYILKLDIKSCNEWNAGRFSSSAFRSAQYRPFDGLASLTPTFNR